jgi:hypothetical protein
MFRYQLIIIPILILMLNGCQTDQLESIEPTHEQYHTSLGTREKASPGAIIYSHANLYTYDAIEILGDIDVKGPSSLAPNLKLQSGTTLSLQFQRQTTFYYAARFKTQKLSEELVKTLTTQGNAIHGIKKNKKTGTYEGFVINSNGEYTYKLPKGAKWRIRKTASIDKKGSATSIKYMGIKDNQLVFQHIDFNNKVMTLKTKAHSSVRTVRAPIDHKTVRIGDITVEIINIDQEQITYRLKK